ncbi:hypothetical protein [Gynuella sp.]|uniref:hypothetical protein n=1 Tax=Gynuella sp. TaxID=2969146 RepID=UPI003D0B9FE2
MSAWFILSTGRCGTQWLSHRLTKLLPKQYWVTHEPLSQDYMPMENSPSLPLTVNADKILGHLTEIRDHINRGGKYVECGYQCWRHLSWYKDILQTDVKVIHLHRNPMSTACLWLQKGAFLRLSEMELFTPFGAEAKLPEYGSKWHKLSPIEKNLYFWAEVQAQAKEYKASWPDEDWFDLPYSQLLNSRTLQKLGHFLDCKINLHPSNLMVDNQLMELEEIPIDDSVLKAHPGILSLAEELGYKVSSQQNELQMRVGS